MSLTSGRSIDQLAKELTRAREDFLSSGTVPPGIRPLIADSWRRSRELGISPDQRSRPVEGNLGRLQQGQRRGALIKASFAMVQHLAGRLAGSQTAILVADAEGLILVAHGDAKIMRAAESLGAVAGARWSELDAGTSGIGTALASGQAVQVVAAEHYCEGFRSLTCTAAPIRHPFTREVLGVLTFATEYHQTHPALLQLATESAATIAADIRDHLLRRDHVLLRSLSEVGEGKAAYTVDVTGQRTMLNRAAAQVVAPSDHANLWSLVRQTMATSGVWRQDYRLENSRMVRVQIRSLRDDDEPVGAIVVISDDVARQGRRQLEEDWHPFLAGGKRTVALLRAAHELRRVGTPVLIVGEAGAGKSALAMAMHRNSGREGACTVIDCAERLTPAKLDAVWQRAALEGAGGTLVLERVEELSHAAQARLISHLDREGLGKRPHVLATGTCDSVEELRSMDMRSELLDRLAVNTIEVPALRDRRDEIPEIARQVLHDTVPQLLPLAEPIRPDAMRALQRYRWPGNVRQLQNVLAGALRAHPRQPIDITSLPPAIVARTSSSGRSGIEEIELEAILAALRDCGGKVGVAAEQLGLSRATVYRRLRAARALSKAPQIAVGGGTTSTSHIATSG